VILVLEVKHQQAVAESRKFAAALLWQGKVRTINPMSLIEEFLLPRVTVRPSQFSFTLTKNAVH
jgi:hypothetical protein